MAESETQSSETEEKGSEPEEEQSSENGDEQTSAKAESESDESRDGDSGEDDSDDEDDQDDESKKLERHLEQLLDENPTFEPPEEFKKSAHWNDASIYEEANKDWKGFWAAQAKEHLHWVQEWDEVLDDSNPPFYKWFTGGKVNASYNCLDRHVEAGNGDRVAFHWRGEEGEERDVTYADLLAQTQKFANGLKDIGVEKGDVVGIYLPMIPEVVVSMLACARIGAVHNVVFGGFSPSSVKERMEVSEAKVLICADGARRKGKTAEVKPAVDEEMADVDTLEHIVVVKSTDTECEMMEERDHWYHDVVEAADDECPAEELDAEHPLFILYSSGSTAKPKGILHTTGGYLAGVAMTTKYVFDLRPEEDVYWCSADVGWVTGHSYIVYGPMLNGATSVMYEGAPDYPGKDAWWELVDRYNVTIFYTAPTAIRAAMKWGAEYPQEHDLSSLRLLGSVGEPINPKAWAWYREVIGGGKTPIVDTWWQTETGHIMISPLPDRRYVVADGDGHDPDLPAAGRDPDEAGLGDDPAPRHRGRGAGRGRQRDRRGPGLPGAQAPVAGDAAHAVRRRRPVRRDLLREVRQGDVPGRRLGAQGRGRLPVGARSHRRCRERVRAPHVDRGDRVGGRGIRAGRGVRGDRQVRRGQGPVRCRVRDARGGRERGRREPRGVDPGARREEDRQVRAARAGDLVSGPAQDAVREDHAPAAARHRRGA